jgi:hypothetical protein
MDGELLAEYQAGAAPYLPTTEYGYRGGELLTIPQSLRPTKMPAQRHLDHVARLADRRKRSQSDYRFGGSFVRGQSHSMRLFSDFGVAIPIPEMLTASSLISLSSALLCILRGESNTRRHAFISKTIATFNREHASGVVLFLFVVFDQQR